MTYGVTKEDVLADLHSNPPDACIRMAKSVCDHCVSILRSDFNYPITRISPILDVAIFSPSQSSDCPLRKELHFFSPKRIVPVLQFNPRQATTPLSTTLPLRRPE